MGTAIFATANVIITNLSTRALAGTCVVLAFLLLFTALFHRNRQVKDILFMLVVAVILLTSTVLFTTAIMHIQQTPYSYIKAYTA